ncbi:hypothetical protein H5410_027707 [Solanum commersonii]|uniref:Uncharacterized protein n=1 Tax=Solanum commersonii TaxID=4109 RepID=A0A9J5Z2U1_SOLCO|nr:hypothetical protein H5410_027707 [Solanum commersonii]
MIIPEKIEKQGEIQKIEIRHFMQEKTTMRGANNDIFKLQRNKMADMEEIRRWVLSLLKPEQKPTTRAIRQNFISNRANGKLLQNYRTQISRPQLFKMLRRRQYHSSCQPGIENICKDEDKGKDLKKSNLRSFRSILGLGIL